MFRGLQYQHAIQLFFRKFGRYPTSIDELIQTNNVRFLRKKYRDPMTKDGEWRLIKLGPNGALIGSLTNPFQNAVTGITGSSGASGASGNTGAGNTNTGFTPPAAFTTGPSSSTNPSNAPATNPSVPFTSDAPNTQRFRTPGGPQTQPPPTSASGTPNTGAGASSSPQSITPSASQPIGQAIGGGIAGIASQSKQESIKVFNKYSEYDKWEFIFDYRRDQLAAGRLGGAQQQNQPTNPPPVSPTGGGAGSGPLPSAGGQGTSPFGGTPGISSPFGVPTAGPRR